MPMIEIVACLSAVGILSYLIWRKQRGAWMRLAQQFPGPYPSTGTEDCSLTFALSGFPPMVLKNSVKIKVNESYLGVSPFSAAGWRAFLPDFSIPWESVTSCIVTGNENLIQVAELKLKGNSTKLYIHGDAAPLVKQWHDTYNTTPDKRVSG